MAGFGSSFFVKFMLLHVRKSHRAYQGRAAEFYRVHGALRPHKPHGLSGTGRRVFFFLHGASRAQKPQGLLGTGQAEPLFIETGIFTGRHVNCPCDMKSSG